MFRKINHGKSITQENYAQRRNSDASVYAKFFCALIKLIFFSLIHVWNLKRGNTRERKCTTETEVVFPRRNHLAICLRRTEPECFLNCQVHGTQYFMRQATCANLQGRKPSSHRRLWDALNRSHGKSTEFAYYLGSAYLSAREPGRLPSFLPVETTPRTGYPGAAGYPESTTGVAVADAFAAISSVNLAPWSTLDSRCLCH